MEPDSHTLLGGHDQVVLAAGDTDPAQLVPFVQVNSDQTAFPGGIVGGKPGTLDNAVLGDHHQVLVLVELRHPDHGADALFRLERQQVLDIHAAAGAGAFRHLVAF